MKISNPKYSIIIPARNGLKYLPTCIETITSQNFTDYELIISDDHSTDDTATFLNSLNHPNIKKVTPPQGLSMAEHWGWALEQTCGDWILFVGQDDGLQHYFFRLAEILTKEAERLNLRTIMSERAYFFWSGCDVLYGNTAVSYNAKNEVKILNSKYQALRALLGLQTYFELPEMYTTSLFSRNIIEEAKSKQGGLMFLAHPQDANLASIACSLEKRYLKSMIPLGWVGSSPKSAGLAIMINAWSKNELEAEADLNAVRVDYLSKTARSAIKYNPLAGDFSLGSCQIYFWGALLGTEMLRSVLINKILKSYFFKTLMFSSVLSEIQLSNKLNVSFRMEFYHDLVKINHCNFTLIKVFQKVILPIVKLFDLYFRVFQNVPIRIKRLFFGFKKSDNVSYSKDWTEYVKINMQIASQEVEMLINEKDLLRLVKRY